MRCSRRGPTRRHRARAGAPGRRPWRARGTLRDRPQRSERARSARQARELEAATRASATDAATRDRFLEAVGPGVLVVDPELRVTNANPAAHELLGRPARSLTGRTVMEAFLDTTVEATVRSALDIGSAVTEIRLAGPDGTAIVVRARRDADGGAWLFLDDVSELRRLQRIRAEFIDNLSHELRTPADDGQPAGRDAGPRGGGGRRRRSRPGCASGSPRSRSRPATSSRWSTSCSTCRGSRAAARCSWSTASTSVRSPSRSTERLRLFAERQGVDLRDRRRARPADGPRRCRAARPGRRQPRPQRGEVQPGRRRS